MEENVTSTFNDNVFQANTATNGSYGGLELDIEDGSEVTGNQLVVADNTADGSNGGLRVDLDYGSSLTMTHGITVTNNEASNGSYGGAYFSFDYFTYLYAPNMFIYNNRALDGSGGGVYWTASSDGNETIIVPNAQVISNTASDSYGGAYLDVEHHSMADLTGSRFERNQAGGGSGGGLRAGIEEGSTLLLNNTEFLTNTADGSGGGAYVETPDDGAFLELYSAKFISNTATGNGGGLYMTGDSHGGLADQYAFVISDTLFERNVSDSSGGAYYLSRCEYGCRFRIDHNRFINNRASGSGGAWYLSGDLGDEGGWGSFSYNEVLSNTSGSQGGGIYFSGGLGYEGGYAVFNHNLIAYNQSNGDGGGARLYETEDGSYAEVMSNTVIYNHSTNGDGGGLYFGYVDEGSTLEFRYNTIMSNTIVGDGGGVRFYEVDDGATLWMTDNKIDYNSATERGGGILFDDWFQEAIVHIERNSIQHNEAREGGGCYNDASYFADDGAKVWFNDNQLNYNVATEEFGGCRFDEIEDGASVHFQGNEFNYNTAGGDYGGIYLEQNEYGTTTYFDNNQIIGNQAGISGTTIIGGDYGGVVFEAISDGGEVYLRNNTIKSNIAHRNGITGGNVGGLYAELESTSGLLSMEDNVIAENVADANYGGISIELEGASRLVMQRNLITGNTAITQYGGLAIWSDSGADDSQYYLDHNQILNNSAGDRGGLSIVNDDATEPLWGRSLNNLIANNQGGGVYLNDVVTFYSINDTVADNQSYGLMMSGTMTSTASLSNTILWNNGEPFTKTNVSTYTNRFTMLASTSDIEGGWPGVGNIDADPSFVGSGDYHLQNGSPAIDTGAGINPPEYDLDNVPRPVGVGQDMGAYEFRLPGVEISGDGTQTGDPSTWVVHTFTLTNTGNAEDIFDLNISGNTWDATLPSNTITLGTGNSTTITASVYVPADSNASNFDALTLQVTSQRNAQIVDTAIVTTIANQVADVSVSPDNDATGRANSVQHYQHVVTNLSNGSDTIDLSASSSAGWTVLVVPGSVTLAASGSTTVEVRISIPQGLNDVVDQTTLTATSAHNTSIADTATDTTTAVNVADLSLSPNNTATALVGAVQVYTHTLTNNASIADTVALSVTSDQGWTVSVDPPSVTLNPGESMAVSVMVTVPAGNNGTVDITTLQASSGNDSEVATAIDVTTLLNPEQDTTSSTYLPFMIK